MKRLKILFLAALLLPLSALAAETTLVVELTTGQTASYVLQDKPVLTIEDTLLKIKTETVQTDYERSLVKRFYFTGDFTGLKETTKVALVYKQTDADHLEISGLSQSDRITVCDMAGRQCGSISHSGNTAIVSLSGQQRGVYLIRVGKSQTIKFVKK